MENMAIGLSSCSSVSAQAMNHRGKFAILVMLLVALALGVVSWLWQYNLGRQALDAWGADAAQLIRHSSQVEIMQLEAVTAGETDGDLTIDAEEFHVARRQDISTAHGLLHYRHALITDSTFDWQTHPSANAPNWTYALRFSVEKRQTVVVFDFDRHVVRLVSGKIAVIFKPSTAEAFEKYFHRQFDQQSM